MKAFKCLTIALIAALAWGCGGKGDTGPAGPQGPAGIQGPSGLRFTAPTSGSLTVISPGNGQGASYLYSVNLSTGASSNLGQLPMCGVRGAFDPAGGILWAATGKVCGAALYKIPMSGSAATYVTSSIYANSFGGISFSPDGTLFASVYTASSSSHLVKIDKTTGAQTYIGLFMDGGATTLIQGIAFSPSGTLYGVVGRDNAQLYILDLSQAGVGNTVPTIPVGGVCSGERIRSIAFYGGTLYGLVPSPWSAITTPPGSFYSFNTSTGACTFVRTVGIGGRFPTIVPVP